MTLKIVAISDTHGQHSHLIVPPGDILIHAGDFCTYGKSTELENFKQWFYKQPHPHKILVGGNHDWRLRECYKQVFKDINYLENSGCNVMGLNFYGMPNTPIIRYDKPWVYYRKSEECIKLMKQIPEGVDVLITHGPPYGILDHTIHEEDVGCRNLLDRVLELKHLKAHFYGHVHEGHGKVKRYGIDFINCSVLNGSFNLAYDPTVFQI